MATFLSVIGVILITGGIGWWVWKGVKNSNKLSKWEESCNKNESNRPRTTKTFSNKIIVLIGFVIFVFAQCFTIIPTGNTGVRTVFGQINEAPAHVGFNWKAPFIESIDLVNNKQQDIILGGDQIWAESTGKIPVIVTNVTITYQINQDRSSWIYANVSDYKSGLVSTGLVSSAIKSSTVTFGVEKVTIRSKIEPLVMSNLQKAIDEKYGEGTITIVKVVIGNMDFEQSYNDAINAKNMTTQAYEQAQIENQTNIERAIANAETARQTAQGEADAALISAGAQAEANRLITASLNDLILANNWIIKWDGKTPVVVGSDGSIIDISALLGKTGE